MHPETNEKRMNIHTMQPYTKRKTKRYYKWYTRRNQLTKQRTALSTRRETLVIPGFFRGSPRFRPQKNPSGRASRAQTG